MSSVRVRYQTYEFGETDIHLRTLRDAQEFSDDAGVAARLGISSALWPLFGLVWESGEVLARLMHVHDVEGLRVLEIGCGIGLASLVLKSRRADITATDHHPEAQAFLDCNVALNRLRPIPFVRAGWHEISDSLGEFDLVIGSDLLYEAYNVDLLSAFIERHAAPACEVVMVDPGRGLQSKFTRAMAALGYRNRVLEIVPLAEAEPFKGKAVCYTRGARPGTSPGPEPGG